MPLFEYREYEEYKPENPSAPHQKGFCAVCTLPVLENQRRAKNQHGVYVHQQCLAVGSAQVWAQAGVLSVGSQSNKSSENDVAAPPPSTGAGASNEILVGSSQSQERNDDSPKTTSLSGASTQSFDTQSQAGAASPSQEYEVIIACLGSQIATPACALVQTLMSNSFVSKSKLPV